MNKNNTSDLEIESRHLNSLLVYRKYLCIRHIVKYIHIIAGMVSVLLSTAAGVTATTNHRYDSHSDIEIYIIWISAVAAAVINATQLTSEWLERYLQTKKSRILIIAKVREDMTKELIGLTDTQQINYVRAKYLNILEKQLHNIDTEYISEIN